MSVKTGNSAESNPAVARCCEAYRKAYWAALDNPDSNQCDDDEEENDERQIRDARASARQAYVDTMPPLFGVRNIRNFIACVAHGSASDLLDNNNASRLLYAAQVAFSTRRLRKARKEIAAASSKPAGKPASGAISEPVSATQAPFSSPAALAEVSPPQ